MGEGQSRIRVLPRSLIVLLASIGGVVLMFMMLHIVLDVAQKLIVGRPMRGTLEIVSYYYMVIAVFLPLGLVEFQRESIAVDVFFSMMPRFVQVVSGLIALVLMTVTYGALCYRSLLDGLAAYDIGAVAMGAAKTVIWPSRFALTLGYAGAFIACAYHLIGFSTGRTRDDWLYAPSQTLTD